MKNFDISKLLDMAQEAQRKLEEEMDKLRVESSSGGDMVKVVMDGKKRIVSLTIDPEIISSEDKETLEDLIVSAVNSASQKVDEELKGKLGSIAGMNIPGLF